MADSLVSVVNIVPADALGIDIVWSSAGWVLTLSLGAVLTY